MSARLLPGDIVQMKGAPWLDHEWGMVICADADLVDLKWHQGDGLVREIIGLPVCCVVATGATTQRIKRARPRVVPTARRRVAA